jgi:hypothetical protein
MQEEHPRLEQVHLAEVQVLLAEKRTLYAVLRAGITVCVLPLTILGFLIGATDSHNLFAYPVIAVVVCLALLLLSWIGARLIFMSSHKLKRLDDLFADIKKHDKRINQLLP